MWDSDMSTSTIAQSPVPFSSSGGALPSSWVRQYRLRHTRKDSRLHTMSDLMGYLLVASDPLLSTHGLQRRRALIANRNGLLPDTKQLLAEAADLSGEKCNMPILDDSILSDSESANSDEGLWRTEGDVRLWLRRKDFSYVVFQVSLKKSFIRNFNSFVNKICGVLYY